MNSKKKVLENSFLYVFSSLLVKAINVLLLPFYTIFLSPEDYGIANLINGFIQVITFIIAFSLYSSAIRFYAEYKDDKDRLRCFYGTIITFLILSGSIFFLVGLLLKDIIISWFFNGITFYPLILIAFFILIFISLHTMHQSILQGMQQGKKLSIINIVVFGLTVVFKLFFVGYLGLGAFGFLVAQLIVSVFYFIFMLIDLKKNNLFVFQINYKLLIEALKYSVPLMPHNLSTHIASFASRIFVNISGTLATVGLYGVAMQFGMLIDVIQTAVNRAFQPWFFEKLKKNVSINCKDIVNLSILLLHFYSLVYMGIGLFAQEIIIAMINERFLFSWTVIPILVVGFSIKSIYYFYINIALYYKQASRKIFISTIIGSFTDIFLAYLLVPLYGMYGAAIAFTLAKVVIVGILFLITRNYNKVGYRLSKMVSIILPSLLFMGIGLYFSYTKYVTIFCWNNLLFKIAVLLVYFLFVYFSNKKAIDKHVKSGRIIKILKWRNES